MAKKKIKLEEVKPADVKGLLRDVPLENPVELTSVTRFSADHILRTSYTPTNKAVVLEDVPAGLKSEFTLGEGGGGGVSNPVLTITLVNNLPEPGGMVVPILLDGEAISDGYVTLTDIYADYGGGSMTGSFLVSRITAEQSSSGEDEFRYNAADLFNYGPVTATNEVNCTFEDTGSILITDPSAAASITLTITGE